MADGAAALALSATVAEFDCGGTEDHDASPPWSFVELREIVQRPVVELLPMALPQGSTLEAELISQLSEVALGEGGWSDETAAQCEEKALECGWQSWLWLQILLMNAMYCGGATARWSMVHPKKHTPAQEEVVARQEMLARKWTGQSQPEKKIEVGDWDKLEEGLGGMYTGASLGKSYNP